MTLNPYYGRGRGWGSWAGPALMTAGALARGALQAYSRRPIFVQPPPVQQVVQPSPVAPPVMVRGRGRPRGRGRGRGRGVRARRFAGPDTRGSGLLTYRDTELFPVANGFTSYQFNPAADGMPRLKQQELMYSRYVIKYMNITYKPGTSAMTPGNVTFGISIGPKQTAIKDKASILTIRPAQSVPVWKSSTITVGKNIDTSRYMLAGDNTVDGVAFTLYVFAVEGDDPTKTAPTGLIQVSYEVEFSFPRPFGSAVPG